MSSTASKSWLSVRIPSPRPSVSTARNSVTVPATAPRSVPTLMHARIVKWKATTPRIVLSPVLLRVSSAASAMRLATFPKM